MALPIPKLKVPKIKVPKVSLAKPKAAKGVIVGAQEFKFISMEKKEFWSGISIPTCIPHYDLVWLSFALVLSAQAFGFLLAISASISF